MDPTPLIHLVDHDPEVVRLLQDSGYRVRVYSNPLEFMDTYDPGQPGCVILSLVMPHLDGLSVQRLLHEKGNAPPVIFLSSDVNVPDAVTAVKAGALEFFGKPCDDGTFLKAIHSAVEQDHQQRRTRRREQLDRSRISALTEREHEVLRLVVSGWLNKEIACNIGISERTVKFHRANLMDKLGTSSLAELVRMATQMDLAITPPPDGIPNRNGTGNLSK